MTIITVHVFQQYVKF